MRIKIGDTWHEAEPGKPMMVVFSEQDKKNVMGMFTTLQTPEPKYAVFSDSDTLDKEQMFNWMEVDDDASEAPTDQAQGSDTQAPSS